MSQSEYLETHPFLNFQPDLRRAGPRFWALLGEAKSKSEHLSNAPLLPRTFHELHQIYLAKGAAATTAIEGNTLSEKEVRGVLEGSFKAPPSKAYLQQEVQNILDASTTLLVRDGKKTLSVSDLLAFNRQALEKLPFEPEVTPGDFRLHRVTVGGYFPPEPRFLPELLERFVHWMGEFSTRIAPGMEMHTAVLKAILAHLYLVWIHPFGDGNGRTARLLEAQILLEVGFPTPAVHLLSNFYNQTRSRYYRELDRAGRSRDVLPFVEYALEGLVDGLKEQISFVQAQQLEVLWRNLIHETFAGKHGEAAHRRRELALALRIEDGPVALKRLPLLTPELAQHYAQLSSKTLTRDVNELERLDLVRLDKRGIEGRFERVLELLTFQK